MARKKNKKVMMWVDPNFKNTIKSKAAKRGKSILEYTKEVSNNEEKFLPSFKKINKNFGRIL